MWYAQGKTFKTARGWELILYTFFCYDTWCKNGCGRDYCDAVSQYWWIYWSLLKFYSWKWCNYASRCAHRGLWHVVLNAMNLCEPQRKLEVNGKTGKQSKLSIEQFFLINIFRPSPRGSATGPLNHARKGPMTRLFKGPLAYCIMFQA